MSTQKILLSLLFSLAFSTTSVFAAEKTNMRSLLHTPNTVEQLLQGNSVISWLENDPKDPIKAYIIINLLEGIIIALLSPDQALIEAMKHDEDLRKEIEEDMALMPLLIKTLCVLLEKNEHVSNFKVKIADIFLAIDCQISTSLIEREFKKIMNEIYFSLNSKIEHTTCISIAKDIETWAIRFNEEIKTTPKMNDKEEASSSPEELAQERIKQSPKQELIYDQEYEIWVYPDFYSFWL